MIVLLGQNRVTTIESLTSHVESLSTACIDLIAWQGNVFENVPNVSYIQRVVGCDLVI